MYAAVIAFFLLFSGEAAKLLASGDAEFFRIAYPEAAALYETALLSAPQDSQLLWRLARVYVCRAEVEEDEAQRRPLLQQAEKYARRCIAEDPSLHEGHTWLAAALGYKALDASLREQVQISREILAETDRAIALDPGDDAAYSIRGSFYRALGNIGWLKRSLAVLLLGEVPSGGFHEAEAALKIAAELAPATMRHHYELGILYLDWDRPADAREALQRAAALEIRTAIDRPRREKALKLLSTLEEENRPHDGP